jgi:peptidoglycan/LPS O-acetylase OafA/YrhL
LTETLEPTLVDEAFRPSEAPEAQPDSRHGSSWALGITLIAVGGLAIRVAYVLWTPHLHLGGDAAYYHYQANLLANGHGFAEPFTYLGTKRIVPSAYHPPLWTLYLSAFSVVGLKSWLTHRLAGCLLGTASIVVIGYLGRKVGGVRVGLVAAGLAAVYPLVWINDVVGLSEAMVLLTCGATLLLAYRLVERPTAGRAVALGVACGLAALSRTEQVLLLPILVVPLIAMLRTETARRRLALVAVCGLSATAVLSPWVIRNLVVFDHPVLLSTNIEPTLVVSNCPSTFDPHSAFYAFWDINCFTTFHTLIDESDQNVFYRHQATTFLSHHKRAAVGVVVARVGRMWNLFRPFQGTRLDLIEDHPLWVSQSGLAVFALLVPLAIAGAVALRRRRLRLLPLLSLPVVVTLTAVATYGTTRFRAPAEISLLVLAATAITAFASRTWPAPLKTEALVGSPTGPTGQLSSADQRPSNDARPQSSAAPTRFPCFDGFRALAILAVVILHLTFTSGFTFHHQVGWVDARLDIGVVVFFLVSGFLLYRPFAAAHFAGRAAPALRPYLRRRILRIIPAYWLALTVIAFVLHEPAIHGFRQIVIYYGFLQIYFKKYTVGGISQAWSLCTEVTFYLFLPVWAAVLRRVARRRGIPANRLLALELTGLGTLYVIGLASRIALVEALSHHHMNGYGWLDSLPPNLDLFALGMGLAVISAWATHRPAPTPAIDAAGRHPWVWWAAAGAAFWLVVTQLNLPLNNLAPLSLPQWMSRQLLYGLSALFLLVPGVFGPQDSGVVRRLLRSRILQSIGVISYGIYLWHQALIAEFLQHNHLQPFHGHLRSMLLFTAAASVGVAAVSYFVVERPVLRLKGGR